MPLNVSSTSVLVIRFGEAPDHAGDTPIERIIVPLDGSEYATRALEPARDLARRTGAHVSLMATRSVDSGDTEQYLDDAAASFDGVAADIVRRAETDPVEAIVAMLADGQESTWIVMSSHGRGRLAHAAVGSVAERIIAEVDVPVVVVGPGFDRELHFIDGPVVITHDAVHAPDIDVAATLCEIADTRAVVLEVHSGPGEKTPRSHDPMSSPLVALWADVLRERGVEVTTEVRPGPSVAHAAAEEAREIGASFVVVTSRANVGMRRLLLGSHTAATVKHSPVPVVVLRAAPAD